MRPGLADPAARPNDRRGRQRRKRSGRRVSNRCCRDDRDDGDEVAGESQFAVAAVSGRPARVMRAKKQYQERGATETQRAD